MPQLDADHQVVKRALIKNGWVITHDPFVLRYKGLRLFIDLAAVRKLPETETVEEIAVEIKVFGSSSFVNDFEKAVGQYELYRDMLRRTGMLHELYLAISESLYLEFQRKPAIIEFLTEREIRLLIYDPIEEEVTQWIR